MDSKQQPLTAIVIGAGFGGIATGVQLKKVANIEDFEIYERSDQVGGVWANNKYPGLTNDTPTDIYQYSFNPKPDWSADFAPREEIQEYLESTVAKFSLVEKIKLGQLCLTATWTPSEQLWNLTFRDVRTGKEYSRQSRFLITAVGHSSVPNGAEAIPALKDFKGEIITTADWHEPTDGFDGKDVVVIGNGASGTPLVPWLMNEGQVKSLTHIFRQPTWLMPAVSKPTAAWKVWLLTRFPSFSTFFRNLVHLQFDLVKFIFSRGSVNQFFRSGLEKMCTKHIKQAPEKYHDKLIPTYPLGSKRPCPDRGYVDCTKKDNFAMAVGEGIQAVTADGHSLVDPEGTTRHADIVVLANGFQSIKLTLPMVVTGEDGLTLHDYWNQVGAIRAYMTVADSKFPNFFMVGGPNSFMIGCQVFSIECNSTYIARIIDHMNKTEPTSAVIKPKLKAEESFDEDIQRRMGSVLVSPANGVGNWMVDKERNRNFMAWPGSQSEFWRPRCKASIKWDDWEISRD